MNKSIRLSPTITEIIKKQIKIADDSSFTLHALKSKNFLSDFENVQKSFRQITSFAAKWGSTVLLKMENKNGGDHYGHYTLLITISEPLRERVKSMVLREQRLKDERIHQDELEKKIGFFSLKTILLTNQYFLISLLTDEERNDIIKLVNYMTGNSFSGFVIESDDFVESCGEALISQFIQIFGDDTYDYLFNSGSIDREVLEHWLNLQEMKFGGSDKKVLPIR
jgi:hypothetical protein